VVVQFKLNALPATQMKLLQRSRKSQKYHNRVNQSLPDNFNINLFTAKTILCCSYLTYTHAIISTVNSPALLDLKISIETLKIARVTNNLSIHDCISSKSVVYDRKIESMHTPGVKSKRHWTLQNQAMGIKFGTVLVLALFVL